MMSNDRTMEETTEGLSVLFTILCIVDLFGVFPIVALPKSVITCGVYGIPLVLSVFALQLYTAMLLGRSWLIAQEITPGIKERNRYPYAAVAELAFGRQTRWLVTFLIDATVFGAGVPNLIVASQSMQLFLWKITSGGVRVSYCVWMLIIGLLLCPVMWLGSPKNMKPVAVTSVCIVTTVAVSVWCCILLDDESPANVGELHSPRARDFLIAYGIIAFQFDIHPMLLTIQVDMKNGRKVNTAVVGGFVITGVMFGVTSALAAYRYGTNVDNNILQGMPPTIPLYIVALLVTVQLCLSSAVGNSALFQHIEDLLKVPRDFSVQRCVVRSSIVAIAVFLGETVPRFDLVMGLVGSTLTGPLMFIFPPLFFLKLCYMKCYTNENVDLKMSTKQYGEISKLPPKTEDAFQNDDLSTLPLITKDYEIKYNTFVNNETYEVTDGYVVRYYDILLAFIVMLFGIGVTIVATYSSWWDATASGIFSPPCLINATAAARSFLELTKWKSL